MKKIFFFFFIFSVFSVWAVNYYFQTYTLGTTAQEIRRGAATLNRINIINTGSVTAFVKFYDFKRYTYTMSTGTITATYTAVPTYTTNPKYILQVNANSEDWNNVINFSEKTVLTFTAGCWARATQLLSPTSTVTPVSPLYMDLDF